MILVDTSVLIDFLKGNQKEAAEKLDVAIAPSLPYGVADITYQEVLQGAADEKSFKKLKTYLDTIPLYSPTLGRKSFAAAARIYFRCRKKGYTIRSTVDCLIAEVAVEHRLRLLHNDRDFDRIAKVVPNLEMF